MVELVGESQPRKLTEAFTSHVVGIQAVAKINLNSSKREYNPLFSD